MALARPNGFKRDSSGGVSKQSPLDRHSETQRQRKYKASKSPAESPLARLRQRYFNTARKFFGLVEDSKTSRHPRENASGPKNRLLTGGSAPTPIKEIQDLSLIPTLALVPLQSTFLLRWRSLPLCMELNTGFIAYQGVDQAGTIRAAIVAAGKDISLCAVLDHGLPSHCWVGSWTSPPS